MADENRVVFPDEFEAMKAKATEKTVEEKKEESNEVSPPEEVPSIQMRNVITVPPNCPPGYQMGADGKCREVF